MKVIKVKLTKQMIPYQAHGMDHSDNEVAVWNVKDSIGRESKVFLQLLLLKLPVSVQV